MVSRRRCALCLIVLLLLSSSRSRGQDALIEFPEGRTEVSIPLERNAYSLEAPVQFKGRQSGFFTVDTGGTVMLMDRSVAKEFGFPQMGPGGQTSTGTQMELFAVDEFDVGGVKFRQSFAFATDLDRFREQSGQSHTKGILGNRFLMDQAAFKLSWSEARLTVFKDKPAPHEGAQRVPLRFFGELPAIQLTLPGENPAWFIIDTGSEGGVTLETEFAKLIRERLDPLPGIRSISVRLSGPSQQRTVEVEHIQMAGFDLPDPRLTYATEPFKEIPPPAAGIIGMQVWRHFELVLDYRSLDAWIYPDPHHGIPAEWADPKFDPRTPDRRGITPLMRAAQLQQPDYVKRFLAAGAPVDATALREETALHYAIGARNTEIALMLITAGAPIDAVTRELYTPLHKAAEAGLPEVTRELLARGGKVDARDQFDRTPLIAAADAGNADVVELLIKAGSDLSASSPGFGTALAAATSNGQVEAAKLLLDAGSDVTTVSRTGQTMLHYAAYGGSAELVEVLLARGIDANARAKNGQTPLMLAATRGHAGVIKVLLEHGADPTIRDAQNRPAVEYAAMQSHPECMRLLYFGNRSTTAPANAAEK